MNHVELQRQLKELGVDIPQGTITRWASEGLISSPQPFFKKKERKTGRPSSKQTDDHKHGSRGRFMDWPNETVEMAAAVWVLRNRRHTTGWRASAMPFKKYRNVPNETVKWVDQKATLITSLFETDCKAASWLLRTYLDKHGDKILGVHNSIVSRVLNFGKRDVCPLIVLWVLTTEKVRRKIPIYEKLYLTYNWAIQENGGSLLEEVTTGDGLDGLELRVTHLEPMQNGFSMDYGFPQVDCSRMRVSKTYFS